MAVSLPPCHGMEHWRHPARSFLRRASQRARQLLSFNIPAEGLSVWTRLETHPLPKISAEALRQGLIIGDGLDYNTPKDQLQFGEPRLCRASRTRTGEGIELLRMVWKKWSAKIVSRTSKTNIARLVKHSSRVKSIAPKNYRS